MTNHVDDGPPAGYGHRYPPASPWVGWIAFAGVLMVTLGTLHAFEGLIAIVKDEYFLITDNGRLAVTLDFTVWGWTHLIVGTIVVVAGLCVLGGQIWARTVAVLLAAWSILVNVAFLAAYPIWSVIMIALAIVVIMALTVHGSDIKLGA